MQVKIISEACDGTIINITLAPSIAKSKKGKYPCIYLFLSEQGTVESKYCCMDIDKVGEVIDALTMLKGMIESSIRFK